MSKRTRHTHHAPAHVPASLSRRTGSHDTKPRHDSHDTTQSSHTRKHTPQLGTKQTVQAHHARLHHAAFIQHHGDPCARRARRKAHTLCRTPLRLKAMGVARGWLRARRRMVVQPGSRMHTTGYANWGRRRSRHRRGIRRRTRGVDEERLPTPAEYPARDLKPKSHPHPIHS